MGKRLVFWDALIFGFTASLTLWRDLPLIDVAVVLVSVFGAAAIALGGAE